MNRSGGEAVSLTTMRVASVNVGQPEPLVVGGETIHTGIFKRPVAARVHVAVDVLEGDRQGSPRFHGGVHQVVFCFAHEHYAHWAAWLGANGLAPGSFGENLTTEGLLDDAVAVGDELAIGTARLQVTQARIPCATLGARHGREDLPRAYVERGRPGFYCRVLVPGTLGAGDAIAVTPYAGERITVAELFRWRTAEMPDPATCARAAACEALAPKWRTWFAERAGR